MHTYCLVNGEIKRTADPVIKVNDLGLMRGYGVFDFFPVRSSLPLFFDDYWKRFRNSAIEMRLPFEWKQDSFSEQMEILFARNELTDGYCRLLLTGGYSANGFLPDGPPNFVVTTQGPIHYSEKFYSEGIKLISMEHFRDYPWIKSINYMTVLLERDRLRSEGAEDVLYHEEGNVTESSRSNFFIIDQDGILVTPPPYLILSGITRSKILEVAPEFIEVRERDLPLSDVRSAQSAFLTSTTKGIMPVTRIDDTLINEGRIHPIVSRLRAALSEKVDEYVKSRVNIIS